MWRCGIRVLVGVLLLVAAGCSESDAGIVSPESTLATTTVVTPSLPKPESVYFMLDTGSVTEVVDGCATIANEFRSDSVAEIRTHGDGAEIAIAEIGDPIIRHINVSEEDNPPGAYVDIWCTFEFEIPWVATAGLSVRQVDITIEGEVWEGEWIAPGREVRLFTGSVP